MKGQEEEDKPPFRQLFAEEGGREGGSQAGRIGPENEWYHHSCYTEGSFPFVARVLLDLTWHGIGNKEIHNNSWTCVCLVIV